MPAATHLAVTHLIAEANEDLGMADGVTVRLHRPQPGEPRVLGFSYHLQEDQLAYLLTEAKVEAAGRHSSWARGVAAHRPGENSGVLPWRIACSVALRTRCLVSFLPHQPTRPPP